MTENFFLYASKNNLDIMIFSAHDFEMPLVAPLDTCNSNFPNGNDTIPGFIVQLLQ